MKERSESSSRRRFLGSALAAAAGIASMPAPARASKRDFHPHRARLERIALRYGSELGDVRRVGRERS